MNLESAVLLSVDLESKHSKLEALPLLPVVSGSFGGHL
jgi:hypothetical protein